MPFRLSTFGGLSLTGESGTVTGAAAQLEFCPQQIGSARGRDSAGVAIGSAHSEVHPARHSTGGAIPVASGAGHAGRMTGRGA